MEARNVICIFSLFLTCWASNIVHLTGDVEDDDNSLSDVGRNRNTNTENRNTNNGQRANSINPRYKKFKFGKRLLAKRVGEETSNFNGNLKLCEDSSTDINLPFQNIPNKLGNYASSFSGSENLHFDGNDEDMVKKPVYKDMQRSFIHQIRVPSKNIMRQIYDYGWYNKPH